jgi:ligand-binding SRPBCC domain-containing protein
MYTYEKTSFLKCSDEELFKFHCDLNNLKTITPKDTKVTLLGEMFTPKEGDILRLKTLKNFIPMLWEVQIEKMQQPTLLVDLALKSPFKFWKHYHMFTQKDANICELKDVVHYKLPFGFLGKLAHFFVQKELESMFTFRHKITQNILEKKDA